VVSGGAHPPGQGAQVIGAGDAGQETKHDPSVPARRFQPCGVWMKTSTRAMRPSPVSSA
jgi:hypothetical protein